MGLRSGIVLGFCVAIAGCGAANPFGYKYYVLKPDSYAGKLEGVDATKDLSLSACAPSGQDKNKCIVMLTQEAYRLKSELLTLRQKLKDCERRP